MLVRCMCCGQTLRPSAFCAYGSRPCDWEHGQSQQNRSLDLEGGLLCSWQSPLNQRTTTPDSATRAGQVGLQIMRPEPNRRVVPQQGQLAHSTVSMCGILIAIRPESITLTDSATVCRCSSLRSSLGRGPYTASCTPAEPCPCSLCHQVAAACLCAVLCMVIMGLHMDERPSLAPIGVTKAMPPRSPTYSLPAC